MAQPHAAQRGGCRQALQAGPGWALGSPRGPAGRHPTHQAVYLHLLHGRVSGPAFALAFPCRPGGGAGGSGGRAGAFLAGRHLSSGTGRKRNVSNRKRKYKLLVTSYAGRRPRGRAERKGWSRTPPPFNSVPNGILRACALCV